MHWQQVFNQLHPQQSVIPADLEIQLPQAVLRVVGWDLKPTTPVPAHHLQQLARDWKGRGGRPPSPVPHTSILISLPADTRNRLHGHAHNLGWKPSSLFHHLALGGHHLDPLPAVNRIALLHLWDHHRRGLPNQKKELEIIIKQLTQPTAAPIWPHQFTRAMRLCLRPDQISELGRVRAKTVAKRIDRVLVHLPFIPAVPPQRFQTLIQGKP